MRERCHRSEVAAAALMLVLGLGGARAGAGTGFADPVGDVEGGAGPDLTLVRVSHTASTVTFRFHFAAAPPLRMSVERGWADILLVGIDVPPRSLKRGPHGWLGLDGYAGLHGSDRTATVVKTSPAAPQQHRVVARPKVTVSGRTLSFSIGRTALGNPAWFEFVVAAGRELSAGTSGGSSDEAPDRGAFHYRLRR